MWLYGVKFLSHPVNLPAPDINKRVTDLIWDVVQDVTKAFHTQDIVKDGVVEGIWIESFGYGEFTLKEWDKHAVLYEFLEGSEMNEHVLG